jgi:hypothetical protein
MYQVTSTQEDGLYVGLCITDSTGFELINFNSVNHVMATFPKGYCSWACREVSHLAGMNSASPD